MFSKENQPKNRYRVSIEHKKEVRKKYKLKNKEKIKAENRLYYKKYKKRIKYLQKLGYNRNKVYTYKKVREKRLQERYSISLKEYNLLLEKQKGKCAICKSELSKATANNTFCVDHDHNTGKVRGLLCRTCNLGIGCLKDNVIFFNNAISYINGGDAMASR